MDNGQWTMYTVHIITLFLFFINEKIRPLISYLFLHTENQFPMKSVNEKFDSNSVFEAETLMQNSEHRLCSKKEKCAFFAIASSETCI